MILVFILQILLPEYESYFYFVPSLAMKKPWTFLTSIFLHANEFHLLMNMFALWMFGSFFERIVDRKTFLIVFFVSGILGNLGYMITAIDSEIPGVGASGAIYGIIGALAMLKPRAIVFIGYVPMPMIFAAMFWAVTEFLGLFSPSNIAHGAHLAGLLFGLVYGYYLKGKRRKEILSYFFDYRF